MMCDSDDMVVDDTASAGECSKDKTKTIHRPWESVMLPCGLAETTLVPSGRDDGLHGPFEGERVLTFGADGDDGRCEESSGCSIGEASDAAFSLMCRYQAKERIGNLQIQSFNSGLETLCEIFSTYAISGDKGHVSLGNVRVLPATEIKDKVGLGFYTSAAEARGMGTYATHVVGDIYISHYHDGRDSKTQVTPVKYSNVVLFVLPIMVGSVADALDMSKGPHSDEECARYNECPDDCQGYFVINGIEKVFAMIEGMTRYAWHAVAKVIGGKRKLVAEYKAVSEARQRGRVAYQCVVEARYVGEEEREQVRGLCCFFGKMTKQRDKSGCVSIWDLYKALGIDTIEEMIELSMITVQGEDRQSHARAFIASTQGYLLSYNSTQKEAIDRINSTVYSFSNNALDNILFSWVSSQPEVKSMSLSEIRLIKAWHIGMLVSTYVNAAIPSSGTFGVSPSGSGMGAGDDSIIDEDKRSSRGDGESSSADGSRGRASKSQDSSDKKSGDGGGKTPKDDDFSAFGGGANIGAPSRMTPYLTDRDHVKNKAVVGVGEALVDLLCACFSKYFTRGLVKVLKNARSVDDIADYIKKTLSPVVDDKKDTLKLNMAIFKAFSSGDWHRATGNIMFTSVMSSMKNASTLARASHVRLYAPAKMSNEPTANGAVGDRRSLHASLFGLACPGSTPEDQNISLKRLIALLVKLASNRVFLKANPSKIESIKNAISDIAAGQRGPFCAIRVDGQHCCDIRGCYADVVRELVKSCKYCEISLPNGWTRTGKEWLVDWDAKVMSGNITVSKSLPADAAASAAASAGTSAGARSTGAYSAPRRKAKPKKSIASTVLEYTTIDPTADCSFPVRITVRTSLSIYDAVAYDQAVTPLGRNFSKTCTTVIVNGTIVGTCATQNDVCSLMQRLKALKAKDLKDASIVNASEKRSLIITTTGGRFVRPLFVVHNADTDTKDDAIPNVGVDASTNVGASANTQPPSVGIDMPPVGSDRRHESLPTLLKRTISKDMSDDVVVDSGGGNGDTRMKSDKDTTKHKKRYLRCGCCDRIMSKDIDDDDMIVCDDQSTPIARESKTKGKRAKAAFASHKFFINAHSILVREDDSKGGKLARVMDITCDPEAIAGKLIDGDGDDSLISNGNVVYVDAAEEDGMTVCRSLRELRDYALRSGVMFSACEIHPMASLGCTAVSSPTLECNQSPRVVFFCHMCIQAMCRIWTNNPLRIDKTFNTLCSPEKAMLFTKGDMLTGIDELPAGQNITIALLPFAENQEDNSIFNKYSVDYGMFRARTIKHVVTKCDPSKGESFIDGSSAASIQENCLLKLGKHVRTNDVVAYIYTREDDDSDDFTQSTTTKRGDKSGSVVLQGSDSSTRGKIASSAGGAAAARSITSTTHFVKKEITAPCDGVFRDAWFKYDTAHGITALVQEYVISCDPIVGDKFSPRNAQKGTDSVQIPGINAPFTINGIHPDIIINTAALPARMTWAMVMEICQCAAGAKLGRRVDGTPFEFKAKRGDSLPVMRIRKNPIEKHTESSGNVAATASAQKDEEIMDKCSLSSIDCDQYERSRVDVLCDMLERLGLPKVGTQIMYSGITGRRFESAICTGPVYYQRLGHKAKEKLMARGVGPVDEVTSQPIGKAILDNNKGIRTGEMERDCLLAFGADSMLDDRMSCDKRIFLACRECKRLSILCNGSDAATGSYCGICSRKDTIVRVSLPVALTVLIHHAAAAGISIELIFDEAANYASVVQADVKMVDAQ